MAETSHTTYDDLQAAVSSSEHGLELNWQALVGFAKDMFDEWDLLRSFKSDVLVARAMHAFPLAQQVPLTTNH